MGSANPIHSHSNEISGLGWYRWDGVPVLGNDYQALAAGFVHPQAGFASSPTSTTGPTSTPGLRMISRPEFSFEPQDRDLMIESAIIDSRLAAGLPNRRMVSGKPSSLSLE